MNKFLKPATAVESWSTNGSELRIFSLFAGHSTFVSADDEVSRALKQQGKIVSHVYEQAGADHPPEGKSDSWWRQQAHKADLVNVEHAKLAHAVEVEGLTPSETRSRRREIGQHPVESSGIEGSYSFQKLPYWSERCRQPDPMHTLANEVSSSATSACTACSSQLASDHIHIHGHRSV